MINFFQNLPPKVKFILTAIATSGLLVSGIFSYEDLGDFIGNFSSPQSEKRIEIYIYDLNTQTPIQGVQVRVTSLETPVRTVTDSDGHIAIMIPREAEINPIELNIMKSGYNNEIRKINLQKTNHTIFLEKNNSVQKFPPHNKEILNKFRVDADSEIGYEYTFEKDKPAQVEFKAEQSWTAIPNSYSEEIGIPTGSRDANGYRENLNRDNLPCRDANLGALIVTDVGGKCLKSGSIGRVNMEPKHKYLFKMNDVTTKYEDNEGFVEVYLYFIKYLD